MTLVSLFSPSGLPPDSSKAAQGGASNDLLQGPFVPGGVGLTTCLNQPLLAFFLSPQLCLLFRRPFQTGEHRKAKPKVVMVVMRMMMMRMMMMMVMMVMMPHICEALHNSKIHYVITSSGSYYILGR